ncbi:putative injection protein [Rhizobium phage RHph_N65]|nr:putative injection protein [Rhizobium phage RHph_N65]
MPIQNSRYYNNPEIGQAFSNLAGLFAPPSGSDLAGYAAAKAKKEEAARLAELFAYAKDPNYNQAMADRMGVLGGVYAPNQSYYAVDLGDRTTRRGQDITAQTSRDNNAADNTRQIEQTRLQQTGETTRSMLSPVAAGATRFVPGSIAELYGVPETQTGVVNVGQGETATLPGGQVITGQPKPLTDSEWQAQQNERLRAAGVITDQQLADAITGKETPVQAVGPDGKTPVYMTPGAATRTGARPYDASADKAPLVEGTAVVDGKSVQVFRRANDTNYVMADGTPVPSGIQVFDKAHPTGSSADVGLKPTEASDKAGIFYSRAAPASANMDAAIGGGYQPSDVDYETAIGSMSGLPNAVNRHFTSDAGRKFYNDAQNFMMSVLRPDTGAAFGADEFQSYAKVFIPMPGDDAETLKAKSMARQTALAALQGTSRGSAENISRILQAQGLPVPPEMAAVIARGGVKTVAVPPASPAAAQGGAPATTGTRLIFDANGNPVQ